VQSYEVLAHELQVTPQELYSRLKEHPTGRVSREFVDTVDELHQEQLHEPLGDKRRDRIRQAANNLFEKNRSQETPNGMDILLTWRRALE
jgi:hypothetical protein